MTENNAVKERSDAEKHALLIADKVEPDFRGKGKSCSSWSAKKWQAAYDAVIECFSSVIPHLPLGFEIKKLEWVEGKTKDGRKQWQANGETITETHPDWDEVQGFRLFNLMETHPTLDEAKAAAQADFERRVRECHVPRPDIKTIIDEIRAGTRQGFLNEGDQPELSDAELSCPYCGGSGHIEDVATKPVDVASVRRQAFEEAEHRLTELAHNAHTTAMRFHAKRHNPQYGERKKQHFYEKTKHYKRLAVGYGKSATAIRALSAEPAQGNYSAADELRDLQQSILQSKTLADFNAVKKTVERLAVPTTETGR